MADKKQELAAISAVIAMLSEEEANAFQPRLTGNYPSVWQSYGRQQTMQYRDITQRRIIKRNR